MSSNPSPCTCVHPIHCRCQVSRWGAPNPYYYPSNPYLPYSYHTTPSSSEPPIPQQQPLHVTSSLPYDLSTTSTVSRNPQFVSGSGLPSGSQSASDYSRLVLGNITSVAQNTPVAESTSSRKRKTTDTSGGSKAKKAKQARMSSNATTVVPALLPTDTSDIVGVGPVQQMPTDTPRSESSSQADVTLNPTLKAIQGIVRKRRVDTQHKPSNFTACPSPSVNDFTNPSDSESPESTPLLDSKPNSEYVQCRLCVTWKTWKNTDGITTTIRKHLLQNHGEIYSKVLEVLGIPSPSSSSVDQVTRDSEPFSVQKWISLMLDWIVVDDIPLHVVECEEFRRWVLYGARQASESDLPHNDALTNLIYEQYLDDYKDLVDEMKSSLGRISLTLDIWSDPNLTPFLAMTAHFCKREGKSGPLKIVNRMLAFRIVEGPHDGENIGQIMYDVMKDAGINRKVGSKRINYHLTCT
ncbi:hypothetical protein CVT24_010134 [Panaeolus cyanescens]|uniref:BED-type domain-containing protein n=1 Tax=Panaeolus cyanescens TaxID=181874 RepID=A0A409X6Q9_9AGAR|nr:hypothetical protein CVT24_010134 [Panaeolus cyanescens]